MRDVSIVGVGQTPVSEHWAQSLRHLALGAIQAALQDANIEQIDAVIVVTPWTPGEEATAFECYKLGFQLRNTGSVSEWKYAEWAPEL